MDFLGVSTRDTASFRADCTAVLTLCHRVQHAPTQPRERQELIVQDFHRLIIRGKGSEGL